MMPWNFFGDKTAIRKYPLVSLSNFRRISRTCRRCPDGYDVSFFIHANFKRSGVILKRERLFNGFFRVYIAFFNFEWFWGIHHRLLNSSRI